MERSLTGPYLKGLPTLHGDLSKCEEVEDEMPADHGGARSTPILTSMIIVSSRALCAEGRSETRYPSGDRCDVSDRVEVALNMRKLSEQRGLPYVVS